MRREDFSLPPPPKVTRPGDRFQCGRPPGQTPCDAGPSTDGVCPLAKLCQTKGKTPGAGKHAGDAELSPCRVRRTWSGRQRRMVLLCLTGFAATCFLLFVSPLSPKVIQPGPLSSAHAQILSTTQTSDRCAACHRNVSTEAWFDLAASAHAGKTWAGFTDTSQMTDLCLRCHHDMIPESTARLAHNVPQPTLDQWTANARRRRDDASTWLVRLISSSLPSSSSRSSLDLACSVCHQEHHGSDADIAAITDAACQSCHVNQFDSFAQSHPPFRHWPDSRGGSIKFDHARHEQIHYPKSQSDIDQRPPSFDCQSCHVGSPGGLADPVQTALPYEIACATCHDAPLKVASVEGPALLSLPTLPDDIASELPSWPATAIGFADGSFAPLSRLMLTQPTDTRDWQALKDVANIDWDDAVQRQQIIIAASQLRQLAIDLALGGQPMLREAWIDAGIDQETAERLAASWPTQLLRDAVASWFSKQSTLADPSSRSDSADYDNDLLGTETSNNFLDGDVLAGDPLQLDPLSSSQVTAGPDWTAELKDRFDPDQSQPFGGWYRDDLTASIRYRSRGHADPVVRAIVDLTASLPMGNPIGDALRAHPSVQACAQCHAAVASPAPSGLALSDIDRWRWRSREQKLTSDRVARSLHHFSHTPHLRIASLSDCRSCHQSPEDPVGADQAEFVAITTANCATCHHDGGAGDHCTQCHRYHAEHVLPFADVQPVLNTTDTPRSAALPLRNPRSRQ